MNRRESRSERPRHERTDLTPGKRKLLEVGNGFDVAGRELAIVEYRGREPWTIVLLNGLRVIPLQPDKVK